MIDINCFEIVLDTFHSYNSSCSLKGCPPLQNHIVALQHESKIKLQAKIWISVGELSGMVQNVVKLIFTTIQTIPHTSPHRFSTFYSKNPYFDLYWILTGPNIRPLQDSIVGDPPLGYKWRYKYEKCPKLSQNTLYLSYGSKNPTFWHFLTPRGNIKYRYSSPQKRINENEQIEISWIVGK